MDEVPLGLLRTIDIQQRQARLLQRGPRFNDDSFRDRPRRRLFRSRTRHAE
jgi:hypothetical protein